MYLEVHVDNILTVISHVNLEDFERDKEKRCIINVSQNQELFEKHKWHQVKNSKGFYIYNELSSI